MSIAKLHGGYELNYSQLEIQGSKMPCPAHSAVSVMTEYQDPLSASQTASQEGMLGTAPPTAKFKSTPARRGVFSKNGSLAMFGEGINIYSLPLKIMVVSFWIYSSMMHKVIELIKKQVGI